MGIIYLFLKESHPMGKVECCSLPGYELRFNSLDHDPPHLHVHRVGEWEIKIDLRQTTRRQLVWKPAWPKSFPGPSVIVGRRLAALICDHREELLQEWGQKACPL